MKTMKKAISVLLLVCMVSALCSAGAYADNKDAEANGDNTGFTIALDKSVFSTTEEASAHATFPEGKNAADYTITWYFGGTKPFTATQGTTTVAWQPNEIKDNQSIYATATNNSENNSGTLTSNTVTANVKPPVSSVSISDNNGTLSLTAKAADGTDVTSNIKTYAWTSDNTNVTLASPTTATTTYSSTDKTISQNANIKVTVTDNFNTVVASDAFPVTIPANIPVTSVTVKPASANIVPGGTITMTAEVKPADATNKSVTWSVSGNATVDQDTGKVTVNSDAQNGNEITVTATSQSDSSKSGSAKIVVVASPTISVDIKAEGNGTYTATATSSNGTTYSYKWDWISDNNNGITLKYNGNSCTVTNSNPNDVTIELTATASATINNKDVSGSKTLDNQTISGTPREIVVALSNTDPLKVGDTTGTTLIAYYADDQSKTAITDGITWKQVSQNPTTGTIATLNGNVVTAGTTSGTVTYEAVLNGIATGKQLTVTVNPATSNVTLTISQLNIPANVDPFTITAKGGVITLEAVATDSTTKAVIPGTYTWFKSYAHIDNGISYTDNRNGTATVSGLYNGYGNGAYTMGVTFTPNDTTKYSVETAYCPVNVKFAHVIAAPQGVPAWDGRSGMSFITNDSYYNFNGEVLIDGKPIALGSGYTCISSPDGRMLVTLTPDCIRYIVAYCNGNGTHTISIGDKYAAAATGNFRTWGTYYCFNGVKTGDDATPALWAALLAVSAVGAGAAVIICKRRKTDNG